jgi:L-lactate dehydrogenase complex protein LldF
LGGIKEFKHLSYASSLCGACTSVCPVKIDLHHHLLQNRRNATEAGVTKSSERMMFHAWRSAMLHPWIYAVGGWWMRKVLRIIYGMGLAGTFLDPMRVWNRHRAPVPLPSESFRARWRKSLGAH